MLEPVLRLIGLEECVLQESESLLLIVECSDVVSKLLFMLGSLLDQRCDQLLHGHPESRLKL